MVKEKKQMDPGDEGREKVNGPQPATGLYATEAEAAQSEGSGGIVQERIVDGDKLIATERSTGYGGVLKISSYAGSVPDSRVPRRNGIPGVRTVGEAIRAEREEREERMAIAREAIIPHVEFYVQQPTCNYFIFKDGNYVQQGMMIWCLKKECALYQADGSCRAAKMASVRLCVRTEKPDTREAYQKLIEQGGIDSTDTAERIKAEADRIGAERAAEIARIKAEEAERQRQARVAEMQEQQRGPITFIPAGTDINAARRAAMRG